MLLKLLQKNEKLLLELLRLLPSNERLELLITSLEYELIY